MKNVIFTAALSLFLLGCGNSTATVSEKPIEKTEAVERQKQPETVAAHTLDNDAKPPEIAKTEENAEPSIKRSEVRTKWTRSGSPIDVSEFNVAISTAETALKSNPNNAAAKKNLSEAYAKRGIVLTGAGQYAAAIGDYRKVLKYDAGNAEAKKSIAMITNIYNSLNREVPPEGEEPEPLEFNKEKA